ncbi:MAG: alpha/beta hydrolase family protein, partial [Beijerinckiaceae bacterium]
MAGALALAAIVLWASLASTPADTARFSTHATLYEKWRSLFEAVTIPADGAAPAQAARFFAGSASGPLIVELPSWRGTPASLSGRETPLVSAVRNRNWSYIRPALAGGNTNSDGCCSPSALAQIAGAVRYAKRHAPVDEANIFIVGESGGGYSALCAMMQAIVAARGIYAWVPVSDLAAWHAQRQPDAYARDVRACTGNAATLDEAEARRRSPLFMPSAKPELLMRTKIYAGIHDGWTGSVPISHSLRMFNHIAQ